MASVMTFSKDEMETLVLYDYLTDTYTIESNVRKHITTIMKRYSNVEIMTVNEDGTPTSVRVSNVKDAITFRTVKWHARMNFKAFNLGLNASWRYYDTVLDKLCTLALWYKIEPFILINMYTRYHCCIYY